MHVFADCMEYIMARKDKEYPQINEHLPLKKDTALGKTPGAASA
jgi:hypothetical protein